MPAARALGVEGVDGAALEGGDGVFDEAALIERVGVDHHLHVKPIRHGQAAIDGGGRGAPILVQFQAGGTGADHLLQCLRLRGIALAGEGEIDRQTFGGLDHPHHVPGAGRAGGGRGARCRPGAAAAQRRQAGRQGVIHLLRADEMDVAVDTTGGENLALAGDHLRARSDDDRHPRLHIRVARLADGGDAAVFQPDIGLDDAPGVDDQRVGDHGVHRALCLTGLGLAHAVADHLAAAEFHLVAIDGEILLHLHPEFGIGQPHAVAHGGAIHVGIGGAGHGGHRFSRGG